MASFRVEWKPSTKRDLRQISPDQVARIVEAVASLAAEPRPNGSQKLRGVEHIYRIRIGDYRAVYMVSDSLLTLRLCEFAIAKMFIGRRREPNKSLETNRR